MSEQQIPAPLVLNLQKAAEWKQTADDHERSQKTLLAQIEGLERQLIDLREQLATAGRHHTEATKYAEMHLAMVHGLCKARGLDVPALPAAAPDAPQIDAGDPLGLTQLRPDDPRNLPLETQR